MIQSLPVDVVRLVVDAIDSPASLAALAGTSKAFSEPALDKLWYRIDNVYVLAKCMPRRLWSEYEGRGRCTCESYRKVVMRKEVRDHRKLGARFCAYASRVQELHFSGNMGRTMIWLRSGERVPASVDESVLATWLRCFDRVRLFPRLRSFCFPHAWLEVPLLRRFASKIKESPLSGIQITTNNFSSRFAKLSLATAIHNLPLWQPSLESLNIDVRHGSDEDAEWNWLPDDGPVSLTEPCETISHAFLLSLPHLPCLHSVSTCFVLPEPVLLHLATLPNLQFLKCQVADWKYKTNSLPATLFPALRKLSCRSSRLSSLTSFLNNVSSDKLVSIHFAVDHPPTEEEAITAYFAQLSNHPSQNTICNVSLRHSNQNFDDDSTLVIRNKSIFAPLSGLPSLRSLALPLLDYVIADENEILHLFDSFPTLAYLKFAELPLLSLSAVCTLIERSQDKKPCWFTLQVNEDMMTIPSQPPVSLKVETLLTDVRDVAMNMTALASRLVELFPNLLDVRCPVGYHCRADDLSREIQEIQQEKGNYKKPSSFSDVHEFRQYIVPYPFRRRQVLVKEPSPYVKSLRDAAKAIVRKSVSLSS